MRGGWRPKSRRTVTETASSKPDAQGRPAEMTTTPGLPWMQANDWVRLYEMFNRPEEF